MATDWAKLWLELNERQRTYLQELFQLDQAAERANRHTWSFVRDGTPPPVSDWRWIRYGTPVIGDRPALKRALEQAGPVSRGTGATWAALETRGYVEREWRIEYGIKALYLRMTARGRKLMRMVNPTASRPPKRPPEGALKVEHWRALAETYAAGERGVERDSHPHARADGTAWWWLTARRSPPLLRAEGSRWHETWYVTDAGVAYYEAHWAQHRALYLEIAAPEPHGLVAPHIVRDGVDVTLLARTVRARRGERSLRLASTESGLSSLTLHRLECGAPSNLNDREGLALLEAWLGQPIATFQVAPYPSVPE